jgi:hypothetical protein
MRKAPTGTLIARIKRAAKACAKQGVVSHSEALERAAQEAGYADWHSLQMAHARLTDTLPVDPKLPPRFDDTPHEDRSKSEIDAWWDRPYAITQPDGTYLVRCLHGGAWDRSSSLGLAATLEAATRLAAEKLDAWRRVRSRPFVYFDGLDAARPVAVVRPAQRPHETPVVLARFATTEEGAQMIEQLGDG